MLHHICASKLVCFLSSCCFSLFSIFWRRVRGSINCLLSNLKWPLFHIFTSSTPRSQWGTMRGNKSPVLLIGTRHVTSGRKCGEHGNLSSYRHVAFCDQIINGMLHLLFSGVWRKKKKQACLTIVQFSDLFD